MSVHISQFLCRGDNFGVLLHDVATGATASIDAPDGAPILAALDAQGWNLTDILVTHRHLDHVEGIAALKQRFPKARVVAPLKEAAEIPAVDLTVVEGDIVMVGESAARVIETPGHTAGHIVYFFDEDALLFAGDTLFSLGCGRVMETPMATMWHSLEKLADLPEETQLYCGHEYTLANAAFALTVDGGNSLLTRRADEVAKLRAAGKFALPSTIGLELATNPFLRAAEPDIKAALGMADADAVDVFAELRERKNRA